MVIEAVRKGLMNLLGKRMSKECQLDILVSSLDLFQYHFASIIIAITNYYLCLVSDQNFVLKDFLSKIFWNYQKC